MHELQPLDLRKWLVHSQKTLSQAAAISQNKHLTGRRADTTCQAQFWWAILALQTQGSRWYRMET
jgi:hypothetical protein